MFSLFLVNMTVSLFNLSYFSQSSESAALTLTASINEWKIKTEILRNFDFDMFSELVIYQGQYQQAKEITFFIQTVEMFAFNFYQAITT